MPKLKKIKLMIPDGQAYFREEDANEEILFNLYRTGKSVREISKILKNLSLKGSSTRRWLRENEELVADLAEEFVDNSLDKLDGASMDHEALELSVEVMQELRKTLGQFQAVISGEEELEA